MPTLTVPISEIAGSLTEKQLEILELLSEGLTGKEIAARLDISNSAATQRIETVRRKFGGVTKNELARTWREFRDPFSSLAREEACIKPTGQKNQLPDRFDHRKEGDRNQSASELEFTDSHLIEVSPPWSPSKNVRLVPEVLDGENAVPARWAFVVVIAIGMVVLLLVLLAVSTSIGQLS